MSKRYESSMERLVRDYITSRNSLGINKPKRKKSNIILFNNYINLKRLR